MAMLITARPNAAHMACRMRKKYGWLYRFWASTADALYTMTTLAPTSRRVAMNSTLSDFSFRAILFGRSLRSRDYSNRALVPTYESREQ